MKRCSEIRELLSEYIDGGLGGGAEQSVADHLGACDACRRELEGLRGLLSLARERTHEEPSHDLWPGIEERILGTFERSGRIRTGGRRFDLRFLAGLAAGLALALGWMAWSDGPASPAPEDTLMASYLLLLHESEDTMSGATPDEIESAVAEYTAWAAELAERNLLESAAKLVDFAGWELVMGDEGPTSRPRGRVPGIEGFFVIRAQSDEQALEIARDCPHLGRGGEVELRPIEH